MSELSPTNRPPRRWSWVLIAVFALLAYCVALTAEHHHGPLLPGKRTLSDDYDPGIYYKRAQFYPLGKIPYVEVFSEYPTLATLSFAVPFLLEIDLDERTYRLVWNYLMGLVYVLTLLLLARSRERLGLSAWPVVLMASPGILYFSLNRFDLLPGLVCCLSLYQFQKKNYVAAHVLLGLGVHLKWYPAVIFPVYLAYHMQSEGLLENRLRGLLRSRSARYAGAFLVTVFLLIGLSILAFGWDGFMVPYRFHAGRGGQYFNPYWLARDALSQLGLLRRYASSLDLVFLLAQLSIVVILLFKRIRSHHEVFGYSILAVVIFATFARIDSPQWILWYVPLALMFVRRTDTLLALLTLTLLDYLAFPIAYDNLGAYLGARQLSCPSAFSWIVFTKDVALLAVVWLVVFREAPRVPDANRPEAEPMGR